MLCQQYSHERIELRLSRLQHHAFQCFCVSVCLSFPRLTPMLSQVAGVTCTSASLRPPHSTPPRSPPFPARAPLSAPAHLAPLGALGAQSPHLPLSHPSPPLRLPLLRSSAILLRPLLHLLPSLPTFPPNSNHTWPYPPFPLPSPRLPSPLRLSFVCAPSHTGAHTKLRGLLRRRRNGLARSGGDAGAGEEMIQAERNWRGLPPPLCAAAATAAASAYAVRMDVLFPSLPQPTVLPMSGACPMRHCRCSSRLFSAIMNWNVSLVA
ncbi:unnamed protein product [Closterium sp. Naga37s-1]|nr:unnamed protein product [Closterium sp. Naga37s-1]